MRPDHQSFFNSPLTPVTEKPCPKKYFFRLPKPHFMMAYNKRFSNRVTQSPGSVRTRNTKVSLLRTVLASSGSTKKIGLRIYYLLTGCEGRTVKYKPEVLKYGTNLRGPCVKNEGIVFQCTARAIRLINSLFCDKKRKCTDHSPRICRQFSEKLFFTKLVQNHFLKAFC